jgi:hypothetical protein
MRLGRRATTAGVLTLLLTCGTIGIAAAATTPAPQISPPPQCFVEKDGALPLCTQEPNGSWTVTYPTGGGNLDDGTGSSTTHDVGLAIVIICVVGIVGIVIWQWVLPRRRDRQLSQTPPTVSGVPVTQATATAYYPDGRSAAPPAARPAALPPNTFGQPASAMPQAPAAAPPAAAEPMVTEAQAAQLTTLNELLNQGHITREEYDGRRRAILGGI